MDLGMLSPGCAAYFQGCLVHKGVISQGNKRKRQLDSSSSKRRKLAPT
jgi:hypothetical protein